MRPHASLALLFIALLVAEASAQEPFWRRSRTPIAGRVDDVGGDSSNNVYALTPDGVFRSTDDGTVWSRATGTDRGEHFVELVAAPDGDLFAGTLGNGLYRSTDDGITWLPTGAWPAASMLLDLESTGDELLAATDAGLFRSTDDGVSWSVIAAVRSVRSVAILPSGIAFAVVDTALLRSSDATRATWSASITFDPSEVAYDAVATPTGIALLSLSSGVVLRSIDSGSTWEVVSDGVPQSPVVAFTMGRGGEILITTLTGEIARSTNDGASWNTIGSARHGSIHRTATGRLIVGHVTGIVASDDGLIWRQSDAGINSAQVTSLVVGSDGVARALQTTGRLHTSPDGADTWSEDRRLLDAMGVTLLTSLPMALDTATGDLYFPTLGSGLVRSTDDGATWRIVDELPVAVETITPLKGGRLLAGSGSAIYISSDGGRTWTGTEVLPQGFTVLSAAGLADSLFVASVAGIYRSVDGATWDRVAEGVHYSLAANERGRLFAGSDERLLTSVDGGATWTTAVAAGRSFFWRIAVGPNGAVAAALRDGGVYISRDWGATWQLQNDGLVNTKIMSITFLSNGTMAVGTDGGGVFVSTTSLLSAQHESVPTTTLFVAPNPTYDHTTVTAMILRRSHLRIAIYDMRGALVATLCDSVRETGEHRFTIDGLPAGAFTCAMTVDGVATTSRVIISHRMR
jgi:hypothetical protein